MLDTAVAVAVAIERLEVSCYDIPTDFPAWQKNKDCPAATSPPSAPSGR
jgi:hypothetical protein